jgi:hypothetical protein
MFLSLPALVDNLLHVDDRVLDLIEIAAYVFIADRLTPRGRTDSVVYESWARSFEFHIRVRDFNFWTDPTVGEKLSQLLVFLTGDRSYSFTFQPGHSTPAASLFDAAGVSLGPDPKAAVMLFSGGIDSLAGAADTLFSTGQTAVLVSHRTQTRILKTQRSVAGYLRDRFPDRVKLYEFQTSLHGTIAPEETQRSRAFLYCSIGYALCSVIRKNTLNVFENGITSLNLPKRGDLIAARASRTTHPQTIHLLSRFFAAVAGSAFQVVNPYQWKTKTEVVARLAAHNIQDILSSSVSCGRGRTTPAHGTHCGVCSQCIDRRMAIFAAGLAKWDDQTGIYNVDVVRDPLREVSTRAAIVDYIRQAQFFAKSDVQSFRAKYASELIDSLPFLSIEQEEDGLAAIHDLAQRHGEQVADAIRTLRKLEDPLEPPAEDSLFKILDLKPYLQPTVDVAALARELESVKPGKEDAYRFQGAAQRILEALFSPDLVEPHSQAKSEDGTEIIDVTFHNVAEHGFWHDIKLLQNNTIVIFELKNMKKLSSPEFAQILSRLNDRRGNLGFVVARECGKSDEKRTFKYLRDQGKVILVLYDEDLKAMLKSLELGQSPTQHVSSIYRSVMETA